MMHSWDCDSLFADEHLRQRIKQTVFDLVIACEITPCGALVAHDLDLPFVLVSANRTIPEWDAYLYNIPNNPSYVPCVGTGFTDKMTFSERMYNSAYFIMKYVTINILISVYGSVQQKYVIKPHLSIRDVFKNAELYLYNADLTLDFSRPFMSNAISLGGGYLTKSGSSLEKELEDFVQSSGEEGIVVFSFGSYTAINDEEQIQKIVMGLNKLPQKVVAKYDGDDPPEYLNQEKFKLMKWLPQNDLLGHSKTKAFVYHGGTNGVYEAIYHAVPMVGIPLYYDQHDNVRAVAEKGMAIELDIVTFTPDDLYEAVMTVIMEPGYKHNAVRLSNIHKDKPLSPKDTMVYWIEFILRHGGKYMQSHAVNLNLFQYYLIDVFFVAIVTIAAAIYLTAKTCSRVGQIFQIIRKQKMN
ncbi:UDP-glucuronosyltransferase 2A2-like [Glandiceps talaboti]